MACLFTCGQRTCCSNLGLSGENLTPRTIFYNITGPTGPTGPAGNEIEVSANRNDVAQAVADDTAISVTGTNILTPGTSMTFANNTVTVNDTGLYAITTTVGVTGAEGIYELAIDVGGTDYAFQVTIGTGKQSASTTHTIYLNISNVPTTVAIYNRNGAQINIANAELNVVEVAS